ncbi:hypothetical protein F4782DRAFT_495474, partial [Xylaria castorea]
MTAQLTFDSLNLISKEITAKVGIKDVLNLSLVSKAVHEEHWNLSPYTVCHASPRCQTILCAAARAGAVSVVEFLLRAGGKARGDGHDDQSSSDDANLQLLECVESVDYLNGNTIVQKLLPYCSDVNQKNEYGFTVLHQVVRNVLHDSSPEIIKSIIEAGIDINALSRGEGSYGRLLRRTALNYACLNARPRNIQTLLENGASAQGALAFDFTGPTAVKSRRRRVFFYGPPIHESQVSLTYAAPAPIYDLLLGAHRYWEEQMWNFHKANVYESVKLLIHHGLVGPQGLLGASRDMIVDTSTVCARLNFDYPELWAILIEGGVLDVHRRNEFAQTFLNQIASRCCGKTLIHVCSWKPNLVRALIEAGSDPNTVDDSGMTPLHWAILYNDFDLVKLLVELGANPAKEINGATPTHYAFGKPFTPRGLVAHKVMSALRRQLTKLLRNNGQREVFSRSRKRKWHPIALILSSRFMRESHTTVTRDAERQMLSIMALLSPFAEIGRDENGNTSRNIVENIGLLRQGDSLVLRPGVFYVVKRGSYPCHLALARFQSSCESDCSFCFSFPRQLL